jgi:hypothetical protein
VHVVAGALTIQVLPPGEAVTVKDVIEEPPSSLGGSKVTVALMVVASAVIELIAAFKGALGLSSACSPLEGSEETEFPMAFCATTVNVYVVPAVTPVQL